ncbi:MAG TPA: DUF1800 domain-containing protein [Thermoanaerobaculia bacterium]|nr:DUF1800 domain-containing protein [Thermoanaerobaculia bacterium]
MKAASSTTTWTITILTSVALAGGLAWGRQGAAAERHQSSLRLPWKEAGLTERQAAAHLLNRFAFGPRPGEIDQVVATGLDRWCERQLAGDLPDPNLAARLRDLPALALSQADMVRTYRNPGQILAEAVKAGVIDKSELAAAKSDEGLKRLYATGKLDGNGRGGNANANGGAGNGNGNGRNPGRPGNGDRAAAGAAAGAAGDAEIDRPELRAKLLEFARERGYRPERELQEQLLAQKLFRAAESQDQLREVMTDFWYNHFNVSLTNGRARPYLLSFERDAIRPNALGSVRGLLEATARHPAMLYYLDNAESTAAPDAPTLFGDEMQAMHPRRPQFRGPGGPRQPAGGKGPQKAHGLNENYARELLELHTLGVDGGYTQQDVIEVARAFTGWTVLPSGPAREGVEKRLEKARQFGGLGFQVDGDFLFRADMHDSGAKTILGRQLPPGRGIEDGERVLDLLAGHHSTARHLATQLAVRFVSDKPPQALVDRLASTYERSRGDVRALLRTLVQSPEFWSREAVGAKVKSPLELAVSAVRETGAHIEDPRPLIGWIGRMGEPLYAYQAPTGYPDRADAWVNTGSLLNRMNFGLQFASQRIPGLEMDLPSLHDGLEPDSREAALRTYAELLLPGRDLAATIRLLTPMVSDPGVVHRVDEAAPRESQEAAPARADDDGMSASGTGSPGAGRGPGAGGPPGDRPVAQAAAGGWRRPWGDAVRRPQPPHPPTAIEQVVGVVLGSPEFQRR